MDSLKFHKDNKVTYYSCEIGRDYHGIYKAYGDTIEIEINLIQLEVNEYDPQHQTAKYLLKFNKDELEWLSIKHFRGNGFEEVTPEVYKRINNWKK